MSGAVRQITASSQDKVRWTRQEIATCQKRIADARPLVEQNRSARDRTKARLDATAPIIHHGQSEGSRRVLST
jgi:hypothetical protein